MVRALLLLTLTVMWSFAMAATYPLEKIETPFVGSRLYTAATADLKTSIVILHGSEGGSSYNGDPEAMMLSMLGYRVLLFCYFDCGRGMTGPRQTLRDVNAEDVLAAVEWLRGLPGGNGKVVVYGFSRGAELAMIVGSLTFTSVNRPDALVAHAPSDLFTGPFNWDWMEVACWLCRDGTACAVEDDFDWNPRCGPDDPRKIDHEIAAFKVGGKSIATGTRIEIEKYEGPILITVGEKDEIWPASQTHNIDKTLRAAGRTPEIHYFPEGGHGLRGADEIRRVNLLLDFLERVPRRR
jgi:dienelactone hydrolase